MGLTEREKQLTEQQKDKLREEGEDPDLPPSGAGAGPIPPGERHWVCAVDGHEDPDETGLCIHCGVVL